MRYLTALIVALLLLLPIPSSAAREHYLTGNPELFYYGNAQCKERAAAPSLFGSSYGRWYFKTGDSRLYYMTDSSVEYGPLSSGTVQGSGTDNHIARWDGTANIQDSGWEITDTATLRRSSASDRVDVTSDSGGVGYQLGLQPGATGNIAIAINGDPLGSGYINPMFRVTGAGALQWGNGTAVQDTSLSRSAASTLTLGSGDALIVGSQAGDHASTTQGTFSYNSTTDKFRYSEDGTYVYADNMRPVEVHGDSAYTVLVTDRLVVFNTALTTNRLVNLPALSGVPTGTVITIKDDGAITVPWELRVNPNGTDTIDGVNAIYALNTAYIALTLVKASSGWLTI